MERITETSPRFQARTAGVFAWIGTTEGFAIWVRSRLVVDSDATATAHNILAHELLYRWAFVGDIISYVAFIIYTLLLYDLFRPVGRRLALLAAVSNVVGVVIELSASRNQSIYSHAMEGGTVCGHAGVRQYWTLQWTMINPLVGPLQFRLEETSFIIQICESDHSDV